MIGPGVLTGSWFLMNLREHPLSVAYCVVTLLIGVLLQGWLPL